MGREAMRTAAAAWLAAVAASGFGPALAAGPASGADAAVARYAIVGDAIPAPLGGLAGDAERGKAIVLDRAHGNCLICHRVPVADEPFQGDLGPDLGGVGRRLTAGEIRLRLVDQQRLNPETLMPPYHRMDGLRRVADAFAGRPVLTAQEIEDVVAWLSSLR